MIVWSLLKCTVLLRYIARSDDCVVIVEMHCAVALHCDRLYVEYISTDMLYVSNQRISGQVTHSKQNKTV